MKKWLIRSLIVLSVVAFSAAVWFAGPLIAFGESRPFDGVFIRVLIITLAFAILIGSYGFIWYRKRKAEKALEEALKEAEETDAEASILSEKMADALETLKRSSGKRSYLYDLPWYMIIGPPGSGKTTALVNSGLKFPLQNEGGPSAIAGVGGTRYCDWWFTEEAVLIDTAGRYTTQDSDADADKKNWLGFLNLLKRNRPKQPINGVIIAISLEDLMTLSEQEVRAHALAIRKRLLEVHEELKVDFPVYALFTKSDLVSGFMEYFGNFTESRRRKVWGHTFQTEDRKRNMIGVLPEEFDALVTRLTEETPDRLHEEPDPITRIGIFGFPAQFANLRDIVNGFLNTVFEKTRYHANAHLRGFYFSSGTQEGTPFDQLLGVMAKNFSGRSVENAYSGSGKSFFLHDLLQKVIFEEAGWVSRDMAAVRRALFIRYGSYAAIGLASILIGGGWLWSYVNNKSLIDNTEKAASEYRVIAQPVLANDTVSDADFHTVLDLLHKLRYMPTGYANRNQPVPMEEGFGLSQRERLVSASVTSYRDALERMFRSRLILRLERQIEANINEPIFVYEAIKVYLMLGGKAPRVDKELIVAWMTRDWEENLYQGAANSKGRQDLELHLRAMLDLDIGRPPSFELNGPLVEAAQRTLVRMNIADRAYALVKSQALTAPIEDWVVAAAGGPDTALVFETVDGTDIEELFVPGFYTYRGFHEYFLGQLAEVADKLIDEQWVLGEVGEQSAVEEQFARLGPNLLELYRKDFIAAWEKVLTNIRLRSMSADKPQYIVLSAASSATSPIRQMVESITYQTKLTEDHEDGGNFISAIGGNDGAQELAGEAANILAQRFVERQGGLARIGLDLALRKSQRRAGSSRVSGNRNANRIPGANIEAYFRPYHVLVEGDAGQRSIDTLIQNFNNIYQSLALAASNPSQAQQATANLQIEVVNLRANASRLPKTLARMVQASAEEFDGDAADTSIAQLSQSLNSTVTRVCQRVVPNRYPFVNSRRDVPISDFARLFAPNGIIDRFFAQNLAPLADMTGDVWQWKTDTRMGRELSNKTLRDFQRASQIREAFFPSGGTMPAIQITVFPQTLSGDADAALLEVNGNVLQTEHSASQPQSFLWPGAGGAGTASITITPEIPGRPSELRRSGPWAFKRLLDSGSVSRRGDELAARFVIGGREVSYRVQVGALSNPFTLKALRQFQCPAGL
ncbi:MAG: type VI secretion system membrane subunit TssM [Pseudomonadota bacterium]